ncbi:5-bromo-4-chloroindolyl phosphate hydrolysis family protein [Heliobacterium mobile]|uniref:5-bromo-4-chloroindolyl phosphate hydrolysis family protein n=1 Tax=Heliobacterium mobile TaxID=28064 RepID=UPI0012D7DF69|nr:5-bromo-4-chloroindolyl phosphate hydrolysis family protein [Heliobacterium mobile]
MKEIAITLLRILLSGSLSVTAFVLIYLFNGFDLLPALVTGGAAYFISSYVIKRRFSPALPQGQLGDGSEGRFIEKTLKEGRQKVKTIGRLRFKIRSIPIWLKVSRLYKIAEQILAITTKDPKRIKKAQAFFNHYLDATITILEKYSLLANQPVTNHEIREAVEKTEAVLNDLRDAYEAELRQVLSNDVLDLDVEINVLKQTLDAKSIPSKPFEPLNADAKGVKK